MLTLPRSIIFNAFPREKTIWHIWHRPNSSPRWSAGESKIFMSTRDTLVRAYMAGAILALAAAFAITVTVQTGQPLLGAVLFPVGFIRMCSSPAAPIARRISSTSLPNTSRAARCRNGCAISEFLHDLRHPNRAFLADRAPPIIEQNPVCFWQIVSLLLFISLLASLILNRS